MRELFATTALMSLVAAVPALAQTAPATPQEQQSPATTDTGLADPDPSEGEIIVTARRREESLAEIPGTISAVTTEQLEAKGPVTSSGDLLATVPGVRFNGVGAENLSEVSIRGSGTQRATGADSGIGLFVNGAYVGSSTLGGRNFKAIDYFDIERVEVLEGPQARSTAATRNSGRSTSSSPGHASTAPASLAGSTPSTSIRAGSPPRSTRS